MEGLSSFFSEKKQFNYFGKGSEFALIFFKNVVLTFITLGIYYPWAKVEFLKYYYQATEIDKHHFSFQGKSKEVFKDYIKIYLLFFVLYTFLIVGSVSKNITITLLSFSLFYLGILCMVPFIIHGVVTYRAKNTLWKGIQFTYLGDKIELFWKCIIGSLLTILTLGIYSSWFQISIRKYIMSHLRFGNLSFDFKGSGETLFWMNLKAFFLCSITFGIYGIWYVKELLTFYAENTKITQNGYEVAFNFNAKPGDIFELLLVNYLLIVFTLGIATPWVIIRNQQFMFRFIEIQEGLQTEAIQKIDYSKYTTQKSSLHFLELNLV